MAIVFLLRNLNQVELLAIDGVAFYMMQTTVQADTACNVLSRLAIVFIGLSSFAANLVLWFRQSIFYLEPRIKALNKKWVQVFSIGVLICYILFLVSLLVAYQITFRHEIDKLGYCQSESNIGSDNWSYSVLNLVFALGLIFMQIALLLLFINPLRKQRSWTNTSQNERNPGFKRTVKKAIALTSICIVTDICTYAVNFLLFEEHTNRVLFTSNINLTANYLAAIACFDKWKQIIWPWKIKSQAVTSREEPDKTSTTEL